MYVYGRRAGAPFRRRLRRCGEWAGLRICTVKLYDYPLARIDSERELLMILKKSYDLLMIMCLPGSIVKGYHL